MHLPGVTVKDAFDRTISYLRLSVTDSCNFRCRYCMPSEGPCHMNRSRMLTDEEMVQAVKASTALGVTKVRLTGGEPLIKKSILDLCRAISSLDGVKNLSITTNGSLLPPIAKELKTSGVNCVNISLDTLDEEKFHSITRVGHLGDAFKGIEAALEAGFDKVKVNTVLIGGFNDKEIRSLSELTLRYPLDVRFIELMPMTDGEGFFNKNSFIPGSIIKTYLPDAEDVSSDGGVAKLYRLPGALGNIGTISPITCEFCDRCNRIRITADGFVKPCLHSKEEYSLKGLDERGMEEVIREAILNKPQKHPKLDYKTLSEAGRNMNEIGG